MISIGMMNNTTYVPIYLILHKFKMEKARLLYTKILDRSHHQNISFYLERDTICSVCVCVFLMFKRSAWKRWFPKSFTVLPGNLGSVFDWHFLLFTLFEVCVALKIAWKRISVKYRSLVTLIIIKTHCILCLYVTKRKFGLILLQTVLCTI